LFLSVDHTAPLPNSLEIAIQMSQKIPNNAVCRQFWNQFPGEEILLYDNLDFFLSKPVEGILTFALLHCSMSQIE